VVISFVTAPSSSTISEPSAVSHDIPFNRCELFESISVNCDPAMEGESALDPVTNDDPFAPPDEIQPEDGQINSFHASLSAFSLEPYKQHFNVDTRDVIGHTLSATNPFNTTFLNLQRPDLYGALWFPVTGPFVLLIFGSLSGKAEGQSDWRFPLLSFFFAVCLAYLHVVLSPLLYQRFVSTRPICLACLLGYSMAGMVPMALFCLIVGFRADFLVAVLGGCGAGLSLFWKLTSEVPALVPKLVLVVVHGFVFFLVERLVFR
jgi:hypothetical protein